MWRICTSVTDHRSGSKRQLLGFHEERHRAPTFAILARVVADRGSTAHTRWALPQPGGWNRPTIQLPDLATTVETLR